MTQRTPLSSLARALGSISAAALVACAETSQPDAGRRDGGRADATSDGATTSPNDAAVSSDAGDGGAAQPQQNLDTVDLLLLVDNSGSMRENQANIMAELGPMLELLTNPPCVSRSIRGGGTPHRCDPANPDDVRQFPAVTDLHVGVVSSDLGTPGSMVPGCDNGESGDDGRLNPIRNGGALAQHLPWAPITPTATPAPAGFRPAVCSNDRNQFPNFITFCSNAADASCDRSGMFSSSRNAAEFTDWFKCNAGLYVNGCGLESQLEAVWRALVEHDARGASSPNAGFLREQALLAVIVLSDEEDGSVRDCRRDGGFSMQSGQPCRDARGVYNVDDPNWAGGTTGPLDLRFYMATPGSAQDPTWSLDRYYNTRPSSQPNRWSRDLLSLKPGHPERVIFAGIAGVPVDIPTQAPMGAEPELILWDRLLGAPGADPNDYNARNHASSMEGTQGTAGPFSMRQANRSPTCNHVVPACRRVGSTYDSTRPCAAFQYQAFPSRRIVEIARRFDQFPACNGRACRNGIVTSICAPEFSRALRVITTRIQERLTIG
ncbi:MAG: hypothetical protein U0269_32655 [Polyangiales bacterium]